MSTETFTPIVSEETGDQTCVQITAATASSATRLGCLQFEAKCLTQPAYVRLGTATDTVTTSNGYYMATGDVIRWQTSKGADHLLVIRATGSDGVISLSKGVAS